MGTAIHQPDYHRASIAFCYYGVILFQVVLFQADDKCIGGDSSLNATHVHHLNLNSTSAPPTCRQLARQDYADLLSTSLSELPGVLVTMVIIELFGRRLILALLAFCVSRGMTVAVFFIARASISGAFMCAFVYTTELYPTTLRAIGMGTGSSAARLGAIVTPFIVQIASSYANSAHYMLTLPLVIYVGAGLLGALATMALPYETRGRQMKDVH